MSERETALGLANAIRCYLAGGAQEHGELAEALFSVLWDPLAPERLQLLAYRVFSALALRGIEPEKALQWLAEIAAEIDRDG